MKECWPGSAKRRRGSGRSWVSRSHRSRNSPRRSSRPRQLRWKRSRPTTWAGSKHFAGQYFEAIPLYRRAVELDPDFAIAYAGLGITYGTAREYDLAAQFSRRAFELRERVSERERFYISARYYMDVLDDGDRAIEVLELWKQTYPRDFAPRTNLSARYCAIGRYQRRSRGSARRPPAEPGRRCGLRRPRAHLTLSRATPGRRTARSSKR